MTIEPTEAIDIFYCYAREDRILRDKLEIHLGTLKQLGKITSWYDCNISAGAEWEREIDDHLNKAHIILLLISPYFMHSDYSYGKEMKRAMERHAAQNARVIPIILRPVDWEDTPFSQLQILPTNGRAVTSWRNQDEAFWTLLKVSEKPSKNFRQHYPLTPLKNPVSLFVVILATKQSDTKQSLLKVNEISNVVP